MKLFIISTPIIIISTRTIIISTQIIINEFIYIKVLIILEIIINYPQSWKYKIYYLFYRFFVYLIRNQRFILT